MHIEFYRVERWTAYLAPHAASMRMKMAQEGFQVSQWCDRPGAFYGKHKHPEPQSHWVISGVLEISCPNGVHRLGPGDRDYMPADTLHTVRVIGEEPVIYFIGIGELPAPPPPVKKKRGRPKKTKPQNEEDLEFERMKIMFGIYPGMVNGGDEQGE